MRARSWRDTDGQGGMDAAAKCPASTDTRPTTITVRCTKASVGPVPRTTVRARPLHESECRPEGPYGALKKPPRSSGGNHFEGEGSVEALGLASSFACRGGRPDRPGCFVVPIRGRWRWSSQVSEDRDQPLPGCPICSESIHPLADRDPPSVPTGTTRRKMAGRFAEQKPPAERIELNCSPSSCRS